MADHNRLALSPVLSSFPWYTTAVSHCGELTKLNGMASFKGFLEHLRKHESKLFSLGGCSESMMHMQRLLGINVIPASLEIVRQPTSVLDLTNSSGSRLCGLICAYRLLDINAWVGGLVPPPPYVAPPLGTTINLPYGMDKLGNWPDLLSNFRVVMSKVRVPTTNRLSNESKTAAFRLLHMIARNEWSKVYQNIEGNFLVAAMHIACMKEFEFTSDSYPDIPDRMVDEKPTKYLPLSIQETEDLSEMSSLAHQISMQLKCKIDGLSFLRAPLQLSLLISPILLLHPGQLMKRTYNRKTILYIYQLLGNKKPESIIEVEKAIWNIVFSLSEGCLDPAELLQNLCQKLPWDKIMALPDDDLHWFDLRRCIPVSQTEPTEAQMIGDVPLASRDYVATVGPGLLCGNASLPSLSIDHPNRPLDVCGGPSMDIERVQLPFLRDTDGSALDNRLTQDYLRSIEVDNLPCNFQVPSHTASQSPSEGVGDALGDRVTHQQDWGALPGKELSPGDVESRPNLRLHQGLNTNPETNSSYVSSSVVGVEDSMEVDESQTGYAPQTQGIDAAPEPTSPSDARDNTPTQGTRTSEPHLVATSSSVSRDGVDKDNVDESTSRHWHDSTTPRRAQFGDLSVTEEEGPESEKNNSDSGQLLNNKRPLPIKKPSKKNRSQPLKSKYRASSRKISLDDDEEHAAESETDDSDRAPSVVKVRKLLRKRKRSTSDGIINFKHRAVRLKTMLRGGENPNHPIDVDDYLLALETEKRIFPSNIKGELTGPVSQKYELDCSLNMWDVYGVATQKSFQVHHEEDGRKLKKIIETVQKQYIDGQAKHVAVPEKSLFRIMTYDEYKSMSPNGLSTILERQNIAIRGMPTEDMRFDEAGLATLSPMHARVEMQDLSIPPSFEGTARLVGGSVEDLLKVSRDSNGRILNALEFPCLARRDDQPLPCSVDLIAWEQAALMDYEDRMECFPIPHTRWGLAGLKGAFSFWHLDSDGFNTFVDVKNEEGEKLWIVGNACREYASHPRLLLSEGFDLETGPSDFPLEAILLTKGTRLIMRPGTLHAVLTTEHTICHGGHFYCTKTMQATAAGLIHAFVCHKFITNTSHPPSWHLLRRILYFFHQGLVQKLVPQSSSMFEHLPQLPSSKGEKVPMHEALNLLSLCNLLVLTNALNPATYLDDSSLEKRVANASFDFNNISFKHRRSVWRCRAVCREMFQWFRRYYVVRKEGTEVDLVSLYLIQQASAILRYKRHVDQRECPSTDGCTAANLAKQIDAALEVDEVTHRVWLSCPARREGGIDEHLSSVENFLLQNLDQYEITCCGSVEARSNSDFVEVLTSLDRQYLEGRKWTVEIERNALASFPSRNHGT